jgi:hypothetical protein
VRAPDFSLTGVRLLAAVLTSTYALSLLANAAGARGVLATLEQLLDRLRDHRAAQQPV